MQDLNKRLLGAVRNNNINLVKQLIDKGVDVNKADKHGQTPLYWASYRGYIEITKMLIKADADVNKSDNKGRTPLYWASSEGYTEITELLKQHGAKE